METNKCTYIKHEASYIKQILSAHKILHTFGKMDTINQAVPSINDCKTAPFIDSCTRARVA